MHTSVVKAVLEERRGKLIVDLQKENGELVKEKERIAREASEREASLLAELDALRKKKSKGQAEPEA